MTAYPDAEVWRKGRVNVDRSVPLDVTWWAGAIVGPANGWPMPCWPCYRAAYGITPFDCDHDLWDGAPPVVRAS